MAENVEPEVKPFPDEVVDRAIAFLRGMEADNSGTNRGAVRRVTR